MQDEYPNTNEGDPAVMKGKNPALMQEISTLIQEGNPRMGSQH